MQEKYRLPSGNAGLPELSYYDLALLVLPIPLFVGLIVGQFSSVSPHLGLLVGATLSAMAIGHLLFGDPPTRRGPRGPRRSDSRVEGPSA